MAVNTIRVRDLTIGAKFKHDDYGDNICEVIGLRVPSADPHKITVSFRTNDPTIEFIDTERHPHEELVNADPTRQLVADAVEESGKLWREKAIVARAERDILMQVIRELGGKA